MSTPSFNPSSSHEVGNSFCSTDRSIFVRQPPSSCSYLQTSNVMSSASLGQFTRGTRHRRTVQVIEQQLNGRHREYAHDAAHCTSQSTERGILRPRNH